MFYLSEPSGEDMTDLSHFAAADSADFSDLVGYLEAASALPDVQRCKQFALTELQLHPGQAVLDLGCGYGSDVFDMGSRVAPDGRAVGADISEKMIAEARRRFGATGLPISFEVADGIGLPFADASFDACRAERVLQHTPEPDPVAAELARVTRPGGRVVLIEFDLGGLLIDSPDRDTTRRVVNEVGDSTANGYAGRQLPRLLLDAGFGDVRVHAEFVQPGHGFLERICRPAVARLATQGGYPADLLEAWSAQLRADAATGRFFAAAPVIIASATRQPGWRHARPSGGGRDQIAESPG